MLTLYHGSRVRVEALRLDRCRPNNDYGAGFYCTEHVELAKEWACQIGVDGFCNEYRLDDAELTVINLNADPYNALNWLAVLFENRLFSISTPTMQRGAQWLAQHYAVDLTCADVVRGYRADDSYFSFARAFLRNEITVDQLVSAMHLGDLGEQFMLRSQSAFDALEFVAATPVDALTYWPLRNKRNLDARAAFGDLVARTDDRDEPGIYLSTLMTMGKEEADACLR